MMPCRRLLVDSHRRVISRAAGSRQRSHPVLNELPLHCSCLHMGCPASGCHLCSPHTNGKEQKLPVAMQPPVSQSPSVLVSKAATHAVSPQAPGAPVGGKAEYARKTDENEGKGV